jgi:hypothetical protein
VFDDECTAQAAVAREREAVIGNRTAASPLRQGRRFRGKPLSLHVRLALAFPKMNWIHGGAMAKVIITCAVTTAMAQSKGCDDVWS